MGFTSSNGITLYSEHVPEFNEGLNVFFTQGENKEFDNDVVLFESMDNFNRVVQAIKEYNEFEF